MFLSVVIPVYNTDLDGLKKVVESVSKIDDLLEVIIIDDGSLKQNSIMYDNYLEQLNNKKIKIIHQQNKGVSAARNLGIELAKGKYLMFVDSDDFVQYSNFRNINFSEDYDLIIFDSLMIKGRNKKIKIDGLNEAEGEIFFEDLIEQIIVNNKLGYAGCVIHKLQFLREKNLSYNEKIIQREDAYFNFNVVMNKPKCFYYKTVLYNYIYSSKNAINRWKRQPDIMLNGFIDLWNLKYNYVVNNEIKNKQNLIDILYEEKINSIYFRISDMYIAGVFTKQRKEKINKLMEQCIVKDNFETKTKKHYKKVLRNKYYIDIQLVALLKIIYYKLFKI